MREFKQKYPIAQTMDRLHGLKDSVAELHVRRGRETEKTQRFYRALWAAFKAIGEEAAFLQSDLAWGGREASLPTISDWDAEGGRLQECFQALSFDTKYTFSETYLAVATAFEAAV